MCNVLNESLVDDEKLHKSVEENLCEQCNVTVKSLTYLKNHIDRKYVWFWDNCYDCDHKIRTRSILMKQFEYDSCKLIEYCSILIYECSMFIVQESPRNWRLFSCYGTPLNALQKLRFMLNVVNSCWTGVVLVAYSYLSLARVTSIFLLSDKPFAFFGHTPKYMHIRVMHKKLFGSNNLVWPVFLFHITQGSK